VLHRAVDLADIPGVAGGQARGRALPAPHRRTLCALYGKPERPATCAGLRPAVEMCGASSGEALATLRRWETLTAPRRG
jgi:hypothetical protein